jgi:hypothetical protein
MKTLITLCCNSPYLLKALKTIDQVRNVGNYKGDIVFFHGDNLNDETGILDVMKEAYNVQIKYFPNIDTSYVMEVLNRAKDLAYPAKEKIFQFHKFYTFDIYFKQWDRILYLDSGIHVYGDIQRIFNLDCKNSLMAHSNPYPIYYGQWRLNHEFELRNEPEIVEKLFKNYNMDIYDYFQTTIMLFDTNIIQEDTVNTLIKLMNEYPISNANDQGIINLYFLCMLKVWKVLPICDDKGLIYDWWERNNHKCYEYILLKYPQTDNERVDPFFIPK